MVGDGVTDFVEVGPGRVLSGLIKRISPQAIVHAVDAPRPNGSVWLPTREPGDRHPEGAA
jgi:malonyl CoA-acyl carrier protein transacylase